jgi:ATP-dependent RNA helicase RhlE
MYQSKFTNRFGGGNRRQRPNNNSHRRFGGKPNRFGGSPRRGGRKNRSFESKIDISMFIKKAEPIVKIEEVNVKNNFSDFDFSPVLMDNIKNKGYLKPTPIQDEIIPHILDNRDVLGVANTGTGKTAAFALPLINQILLDPSKRIIILAPTRELAQQIKQDIRSFTFGMRVYVALAIGGSYIREQILDIKRDPHIIVGTPGRIKDLGKRRIINFSSLNTLILDEVDRMLDMGFIEDIKEIVNQIPKPRQTLFFSATVDRKIEHLIDSFLTDPVKISVKTQESSKNVEQDIIKVKREEKETVLHRLLGQDEFKKVLVFGGTKSMVEKISVGLYQKGFKVGSLHGDKAQNQRQRTLRAFKENMINILIATDVAARGLDVADITHVINFDKPNNYEDYVHRIGRTGRGNSAGFALTFVESSSRY